MVDLADRGVLAEQQAVALAQLGDVADQQHAAAHVALLEDRHAATQQRHLGALLELLDDGHPALERLAHRSVVEAELGESHAERVAVDPDPVQRRVGVGRHVADPGVVIEGEHAVADAGRGAGVLDPPGEGERAVGDHRREAVEDRQIGALERARWAAGPLDPLAGENGDQLTVAANRHRLHTRLIGQLLDADLALDDLAVVERLRQHRSLRLVGPTAHPVGVVDGLRRRGAHLTDGEPLAVAGGHVEQQVGEAEVGEHAPLGHQPVEMCHLFTVQPCVFSCEISEQSHR